MVMTSGSQFFACNSERTHEAGGVGLVGANLAVNLNKTLLEDGGDLLAGEGVLEAVAQEDGERKRLAELVRAGRGARGLLNH